MKTIYLHVGANKAGTTSIQRFLSKNSDWLAQKGVLYPEVGVYDNAHYELSSCLRFGPNLPYDSKFSLSDLKLFIDRSGLDRVVLSSEFFMLNKFGDFQALKDFLSDYKVRIIIYLRRHDLWFESLYNQAVKTTRNPPWKKGVQSYLDFQLSRKNISFDYLDIVDRWANLFGKESVIIRPFERQQFFNNDLVSDFLEIIGVSSKGRPSSPTDHSNASLSVRILDFVDSLNRVEGLSAHDKAIAIKIVGEMTKGDRKRFALSPDQRISLIRKFEASYEVLSRDYLGRTDGRLFYEAEPLPDPLWKPPEVMSLGQALGLFARLAKMFSAKNS